MQKLSKVHSKELTGSKQIEHFWLGIQPEWFIEKSLIMLRKMQIVQADLKKN